MKRPVFLVPILLLTIVSLLYPQYEVSVTSIRVWVKIRDKSGKPVLGLNQPDFEVFEDNKRVALTCFEEVSAAPPDIRAAIAPKTESRAILQRFVIYLDLYNTTPREYAAVKPRLQEFVRLLSGKNVEIMLVALLANQKLGIVTPFTRDFQRVARLLNQAKGNASRDVQARSRMENLKKALESQQGLEKTGDHLDRLRDGYETARAISRQEEQIGSFTLRALEAFADKLAQMRLDNVSMIFVSGGFSMDPGRRYYNVVESRNVLNTRESLDYSSYNSEANLAFREEMKKSIGKFNRLNITFYTIDTRATDTEAEYQDSLIQIAKETGGLAFFNSSNFINGLQSAYKDLAHQYLLCYNPPQHKKTGEYHKIKVQVKRPGVELRYRQGYID